MGYDLNEALDGYEPVGETSRAMPQFPRMRGAERNSRHSKTAAATKKMKEIRAKAELDSRGAKSH